MTHFAKFFLALAGMGVLALLWTDWVFLASEPGTWVRWGQEIEIGMNAPSDSSANSWEYPMDVRTNWWGSTHPVPTNASPATNFILEGKTNQFDGGTNAFDRTLRHQTNAIDPVRHPIDALDRPGDARTNVLEESHGVPIPE